MSFFCYICSSVEPVKFRLIVVCLYVLFCVRIVKIWISLIIYHCNICIYTFSTINTWLTWDTNMWPWDTNMWAWDTNMWPWDTNYWVLKLKEMLSCKGTIRIHKYNGTSIKIKQKLGQHEILKKKWKWDKELAKDKHILSHYITSQYDVLTSRQIQKMKPWLTKLVAFGIKGSYPWSQNHFILKTSCEAVYF